MKRLGLLALLGILGAVLYVALLSPRQRETPEGLVLPPMDVKVLRGDAYRQGKPLLLEFWATWCGPCRENIPHLNELHKKYGPRGLQVIGVSQENSSTVERFMESVPMHYTVAQDVKGNLSDYFRIDAIPHAFLIDRQGNVKWSGHPAALDSGSIESLLVAIP